jgi:hypothetical protein
MVSFAKTGQRYIEDATWLTIIAPQDEVVDGLQPE